MNVDIICISETHCANNIDCQPYVPGYKWYGHCRKSRNVRSPRFFGGVGLFVKDDVFNSHSIDVISCDYDGILGVLLKNRSNGTSYVVISCYLPPEDSPWGRNADNFFNHLLSLVYTYTCNVENVLICGDFNARVGNLNDFVQSVDNLPQRNHIDTCKNSHGQVLVDFLQESNMCIVNGRIEGADTYTCISTKGQSVVDYFLINHSSLSKCSEWKVLTPTDVMSLCNLETLISSRCKPPDHSVITMKVSTSVYINNDQEHSNSLINETVIDQNLESERYDIYSEFSTGKNIYYSNIPESFLNTDTWRRKLQSFLIDIEHRLSTLSNQQDMDTLYENICQALFHEIKEKIRIKESSKQTRKNFKYYKPFWNEELTNLWKKMRDAEKKYCKSKHINNHIKQMLRKEFSEAQNLFDRCLRRTERMYYKNLADHLENINTSNPKEFWDHIKKLGPKKNTDIPVKTYTDQGDITTDLSQVLTKWENDFHSLFNSEENLANFDTQFLNNIKLEKSMLEDSESQDVSGLNNTISQNEIQRMIRKLKNKKSVGPDCIPNEIIKTGKLNDLLCKLFQMCFDNGVLPTIWKKSIIVPIPKNALLDPCIPLNYRGISLLSCIYKLYTSILNDRLVKYNDSNNLIADEQNGFRKDRNCIDHIFTLTSIIRNRKKKNLETFCAFIDYQKAFDWVNRDILLYKLMKFFNIHGKFYNSIKCLLSNSAAKIRINNFYTNWFNVSSGVRQGDTLSPTLFSMYINDLVNDVNNISCGVEVENTEISILLYADDVVLIAPSEYKLQKQLDLVAQWGKKWLLLINETKSQIVHFRKKSKLQTEQNFVFGERGLNVVSKYKYLGVFLDESLDFSLTAEILANAGNRALGGIINRLQTLRNVNFSTFSKLYDTGVRPIINYAAAIWSYKNSEKMSILQRRAIRYFLGVHRFAPTHAIEGDMGWLPSKISHYLEMLSYWNRLVSLPVNRITRKVFDWDCNQGNNNWSSEICELFSICDCLNVFENREVCDIRNMQVLLMNVEVNNWDVARHNKDKLRTYNMFKWNYGPEEYVYTNLSRKIRSLIAQFRSGTLPLNIEVGRFRNIPVENRTCFSCTDKVEDEFHLLCECVMYDDLRVSMFQKISLSSPMFLDLEIFDKFIEICNNYQIDLGKFLIKAMDRRTAFLFNI